MPESQQVSNGNGRVDFWADEAHTLIGLMISPPRFRTHPNQDVRMSLFATAAYAHRENVLVGLSFLWFGAG